MSSPVRDLIQAHWPQISQLYNEHAAQRPVMLLDVEEGEIHAFPVEEFASLLEAGSRAALEQQYRRAVDQRQMVLFVRGTKNGQFLSYSLKLEDD